MGKPKTNNSLVPEYADNPLIEALGSIPDTKELTSRLIHLLPKPGDINNIPKHIRLHLLQSLKDLYIPPETALHVATSLDLMLRQGYTRRRPKDPGVWRYIYQKKEFNTQMVAPPLCAAVMGISGTGKTRILEQALQLYDQVTIHDKFSNMASPVHQVAWLKIDAPASGRAVDLADNLFLATDEALGTDYFRDFSKGRRRGPELLLNWLQKAASHFLGILVVDEIQNLFKLETLARRRAAKGRIERPELRIVDDESLKFLLTFTNTARMPLAVSGTPDGMAAFSSRLSTAERFTTGGFHHIHRAESAEDEFFVKYMFPELCTYQLLEAPLQQSKLLGEHVIDLSGGVQRIYILLWGFAQRCAFERKSKALEFKDFDKAMATYLAPLRPAIEALKSDHPDKLSKYEDLLPRKDEFWAALTGSKP